MDKLVIIGSGASGVHFALSVLHKGYDVIMLDVGYVPTKALHPEDSFVDLKRNLSDPVRYFLGASYEGVIFPENDHEYYGFPPSKKNSYSTVPGFEVAADGFEPLVSFGQGGLAELWTGGVYPFNDDDLKDFPFGYTDLEPYYSEIARRIGITGTKDDLARSFPFHGNLVEPLSLDTHSELLLQQYERQKDYLNSSLATFLGRSRVATLSRSQGEREGCTYRGRCLWGCPVEALYTPTITLKECQGYPNFTYLPNNYVRHFKFDVKGHIQSVVVEALAKDTIFEIPADKFILAAGTLSSSKIFMDSIWRNTGEVPRLNGLMDNRQVLIPFINIRMIGETYETQSYQYHQIAVGIESQKPEEYIHGQITTLKTALVHPIIQRYPLDLRSSILLFRNLRAGLGLVNVNLHDRRRQENYITLQVNEESRPTKLRINYLPEAREEVTLKETIRKVKKILWKLGCIVPPGTVHIRPMGASVHYAGTLPMSKDPISHTVSEDCRSHDLDNLYIVDGATFPFLPSKNITFTLMANAVRVADKAF